MANKGAIYMVGMDSLSKKLKQNVTADLLKEVVKANAAKLQSEAMWNAPVDTGYMERNITLSIDPTGLAAKVKSNAEYSGYVEFGTRFQNPEPFMFPAYKKVKNQFKKDMKMLVK